MEQAKCIGAFPAGTVPIPPSKSLSHRALICAGLATLCSGGESTLERVGENEDIEATRACLQQLGVIFTQTEGVIRVSKGDTDGLPAAMDCNESGSTLRFLLPVAALQNRRFAFTGRGRLMQRPLEVYRQLFEQKGVHFEQANDKVIIQGPLPSGEYQLPGDISSQFVSGLLLALPLLPQDSRIILDSPLESAAYVTLTIDAMAHFGVRIQALDDGNYHVKGKQQYRPQRYCVEGDWSQAAFFLAAGALGRPVKCAGLTAASAQGDRAILDILQQMGVTIEWKDETVSAQPAKLIATNIDAREIPDLVPVLAVLCSLATGTSHITGAGRLRLKESDRLDAMATELEKLGAAIVQGPDSLTITGKPQLNGGEVDTHNDHRIAMAMAVAAIRCENPVCLTGWQHVRKSYPHFWADFEKEAKHG